MTRIKPDVPTIITRIIKACSLPEGNEKDKLYKLDRHQLLELMLFVEESNKTISQLTQRIEELASE